MRIEVIDEYFKQIKVDCLKKIRQQGVHINLEGPKTKEPPSISNENVIPYEHDNKFCKKENIDGEKTQIPTNCLTAQGICHESRVQYLLERERNGEIQLQCCMEEQQCGPSYEVSSAIENLYIEDILDRNEDEIRNAILRREVTKLYKCEDNTIEMQDGLGGDTLAFVYFRQTDDSMQEKTKRNSKGNCNTQDTQELDEKENKKKVHIMFRV